MPLDPDGITRRRLTLSDRQRRVIESRGRTIIQPKPPDAKTLAIIDQRTREGVPMDAVFALEALRHLAEQGNLFARFMYEQERIALGIDRPKTSAP